LFVLVCSCLFLFVLVCSGLVLKLVLTLRTEF